MTNEHPPGHWIKTGRGARFVLEPVNPAPAYCWYCSAATLAAVYKAHVASDSHYDFACWRDLSYATDKGIVFG